MFLLWIQFIACAGVIVYSGTYLSRYGDVIAEKTGLGRTWIGLVLMAVVTSLPELINGVSSVTIADVPDIAMGDVMGSLIFNLSLVAVMDALHGPGPIFSAAHQGHVLSAGFGIILTGIVVVSMLSGEVLPSISHVGLYTPLIIFVYLIGVRGVFVFEKRKIAEFVEEMAERVYEKVTLREAALKYSISAFVIIGAATLLPFIGDRIAQETGLGRSFVGTFFIGMTTSLPELAVSIASLRIGAIDMAVANLFGSNMFDILIVAIDDIFYTKGPILMDVSANHAITGFMAVIMTSIAVVGLIYRLKRKTVLKVGWDTLAIALSFVVTAVILYLLREGG